MREPNFKAIILLALFAALSLTLTARNNRGWTFDVHSGRGHTRVLVQAAALRFAFAIEQPCSKTDTCPGLS